MHGSLPSARLVVLLCAAYVVLGAAGLVLAIPPGYASPVFPAAGLALACLLWYGRPALPGIWLGSFLLNLSHAWLGGTLTPVTAAVSVGIATGATVQAWAGCWLVGRRLGPAWQSLATERETFSFLFFGGVLPCLLSASLSVAGLYAAGIIKQPTLLFTWWNWYVGDALGVLVFAPLTVCLLNGRGGVWGWRLWRIVAPMLLTLGLVAAGFYFTSRGEKVGQNHELEEAGSIIAGRIADRLTTHREVLMSLRHFIEATPDFSFRQFEQFTRITLQDNTDIFAMSFNDLVTIDQRTVFERRMSGLSPLGRFRITERDRQQRLVPAETRPVYVAVRYIVPLASNLPAVGFDIHAEPVRRAAIQRAMVSGKMAVTAPIQLVQEQQQRVGILELLPVVNFATAGSTTRAARLLGFAVAVVKVDEMIAIATRGLGTSGLVFQVRDAGVSSGRSLLYCSARDAGTIPKEQAADWKTALRMGDRDWELSVYMTDQYRQQNRPWMAWVVGVAGLMFATLLQVLLLGMTGRTAIIQRKNAEISAMARTLEEKVSERTAQLSAINRQLTGEIGERRRTEKALQEALQEAGVANRAKTAFLANMSHEIRTPMSGVLGMSELLMDTSLSDRQRTYAERIKASGEALMAVLNDILDYAEIEAGSLALESSPFSLQEVIQGLVAIFRPRTEEKGLLLQTDIGPELPDILLGDPRRLTQVLGNLLDNAVKFTEAGEIRLAARVRQRTGTAVLLEVSVQDTGIGMTQDQQVQLFTSFSQADASTTRFFGGIGLGLSISRQLVELMGGTLQAESTPGTGSLFTVALAFQVVSDVPGPAETLWTEVSAETGEVAGPGEHGTATELQQQLERLEEALEHEDPRPCKEIMGGLLRRQWPPEQMPALKALNLLVQCYRLAEARALIDREFKNTMKKRGE